MGGTTTAADCAIALRFLTGRKDLVDGPSVPRFEQAFAQRIGVRHAISLATGRVGLHATLAALGVGAGDEVLLPAPTHIVVANAVRYLGATPVYVDCDPHTFAMDVDRAAAAVSRRTRAIVVQHTFGIPAPLASISALGEAHDIPVIEDCVHALGATWKGRPLGSFGRAAFFSTEETKMISTTLGGVVVTDDDRLAEALRAFQSTCAPPSNATVRNRLLKLLAYHLLTWPPAHGASRSLYELAGRRHPLPLPVTDAECGGGLPIDYASRFSNAQAAIGIRQLTGLEANLAHRRAIAAIYAEELGAVVSPATGDGEPSFVRFPVLTGDRAAATKALRSRTVVGTWFTSVLEEATSPTAGGYVPGSCPTAEWVCRHLVNLPTHQRVRPTDARELARIVAPFAVDARAVVAR